VSFRLYVRPVLAATSSIIDDIAPILADRGAARADAVIPTLLR
jgi:hypothetical protein